MAPNDVIAGWVASQLAPWKEARVDLKGMRELEGGNLAIYRFSFGPEGVKYREKPNPIPGKWHALRAKMYMGLLEEAYATYCRGLSFEILLFAEDQPRFERDVPVFPFQKPDGSKHVLLPDIDFIKFNYYQGAEWDDRISFNQKSDSATFVGSTSGVDVITSYKLSRNLVPRIKSALYFKDNPRVTFELPVLCQYASDVVRDAMISMGLGADRISWAEQLKSKILLSMDGNGASCSRVIGALGSNSVLAKYHSPHVLYYFEGLIPGEHYLPIASDAEVIPLLDAMVENPDRFAAIATRSRTFHDEHLKKAAVVEYTGRLLRAYSELYRAWSPAMVRPPGAAVLL